MVTVLRVVLNNLHFKRQWLLKDESHLTAYIGTQNHDGGIGEQRFGDLQLIEVAEAPTLMRTVRHVMALDNYQFLRLDLNNLTVRGVFL